MDFATRDRYRHAVEDLARGSRPDRDRGRARGRATWHAAAGDGADAPRRETPASTSIAAGPAAPRARARLPLVPPGSGCCAPTSAAAMPALRRHGRAPHALVAGVCRCCSPRTPAGCRRHAPGCWPCSRSCPPPISPWRSRTAAVLGARPARRCRSSSCATACRRSCARWSWCPTLLTRAAAGRGADRAARDPLSRQPRRRAALRAAVRLARRRRRDAARRRARCSLPAPAAASRG